MAHRFSIYGRFQVEIARENDAWVFYRLDLGKRLRMDEIAIPSDLGEGDLATYLDGFKYDERL